MSVASEDEKMPRQMSNWRGIFRLIDIGNNSVRSNVITSLFRSIINGGFSRIGRYIKEFGPYALMELLLPGGSVVALTVWLYRRRRKLA